MLEGIFIDGIKYMFFLYIFALSPSASKSLAEGIFLLHIDINADYIHISGQIIATSHDRLTPNGGLVREIPLFQGYLGW